jgi:hypothetical protein
MSAAIRRMLWEREVARNRKAYEAQIARIGEVQRAFLEGMLAGMAGPNPFDPDPEPLAAWRKSKAYEAVHSGPTPPLNMAVIRCDRGHPIDWAAVLKAQPEAKG